MIVRSVREVYPVAVSQLHFLFRIAESSASLARNGVLLIEQPAYWNPQKLIMTIDNSRGDTHAVVELVHDSRNTALRMGAYETLQGLESPTIYICTAQKQAFTAQGHVPMRPPIHHKEVADRKFPYWTRTECWSLASHRIAWLTVTVEKQVYREQPAVSIELAVSLPSFRLPLHTPEALSGVAPLQEIEDMMSARTNGASKPSQAELSLARDLLAVSSFGRTGLKRYKKRMAQLDDNDDGAKDIAEELATDLREKMLAVESHVDPLFKSISVPKARAKTRE